VPQLQLRLARQFCLRSLITLLRLAFNRRSETLPGRGEVVGLPLVPTHRPRTQRREFSRQLLETDGRVEPLFLARTLDEVRKSGAPGLRQHGRSSPSHSLLGLCNHFHFRFIFLFKEHFHFKTSNARTILQNVLKSNNMTQVLESYKVEKNLTI
jgi:hypothetical protein